jgi:transaldolase
LTEGFHATNTRDGFVSLEVSPQLARDTEGSIAEARRLWNTVDRPNVMIKIPGTREGWPAIERCLAEGININITLLFSVEHYSAVAEAYLRALETRLAEGHPIDRIASVASLFVSRVDTEAEVDKRIQSLGGPLMALRGRAAIAGAQLAYAAFAEISRSARWRSLAAKGARPQRLLWASMDALAAGGIDFHDVNHTLEEEGIEKFARSFDELLAAIAERRSASGRVPLIT